MADTLAATLRPDATTRNGPFSAVGAASRHAALADDNPATWIEATGFNNIPDYAEVSLGDWARSAFGVSKIVARVTGSYRTARVDIVTGSTLLAQGVYGNYGVDPAPTTYTGDLTQAQLDDLRVRVWSRNDLDAFDATEVFVDIYAVAPSGATTLVTIDSVTTEDATPTGSPHVISTDPDHDDAEVRFTATHDGQLIPFDGLVPSDALYPGVALDIIGWKLVVGSLSTGKPIAQQTNRASPNRPCGARTALHEAVSPDGFRVASGTQVVVPFTFIDASDGGADGPRTVSVFVLTDMQGWTA